VDAPELYTLLSPDVVAELKLRTLARDIRECHKYYEEQLYYELKAELELS
jgi:hypothetical protein